MLAFRLMASRYAGTEAGVPKDPVGGCRWFDDARYLCKYSTERLSIALDSDFSDGWPM